MRISDWSSDVCSSDLWAEPLLFLPRHLRTLVDAEPRRGSPREFKHRRHLAAAHHRFERFGDSEIGRASCRERVCQYRVDLGGRRIIKKKNKNNNKHK